LINFSEGRLVDGIRRFKLKPGVVPPL